MRIDEKLIRNKLGLINLAEDLGNVSKDGQDIGFSSDRGGRN